MTEKEEAKAIMEKYNRLVQKPALLLQPIYACGYAVHSRYAPKVASRKAT